VEHEHLGQFSNSVGDEIDADLIDVVDPLQILQKQIGGVEVDSSLLR
jgi:hypothetical protein